MLNLSILLEDSARKYPYKTAFVAGTQRLSFKEVNAAANQVANALNTLDINQGDKVALSCPNLMYFPIVYYGILKAGAVVVPLSILLKQEEVAYHLKDSDAKAYFCFEGSESMPMGQEGYAGFLKAPDCHHYICLEANPAAGPGIGTMGFRDLLKEKLPAYESAITRSDDTAIIIYTSGTTGKPKGAELTHGNMAWNADLCRHLFELEYDDIFLEVLPLFHIFGQTCMMNCGVMHAVTGVLLPRFEVETVVSTIIEEGVTIFAGVPTMYWALLHQGPEAGSKQSTEIKETLRTCVSGGAALPQQVLEGFESRFEVPILEGYGMSEGSPVVTFNQPGFERKVGSIGLPVWGVEVKLVDGDGNDVPIGEKGELLYRGHNVMKGYYNKPEATAETLVNGWLHSGDVAVQDEDGYFYIVDRTKDMIIRGGLNVYPREVEELMITHDDVSLVAVIGVPDEALGEEIKAFVVRKEGAAIDEKTLIQWTKDRIAAYKYPRQISFVDSLPMNATGKILKRELRNVI